MREIIIQVAAGATAAGVWIHLGHEIFQWEYWAIMACFITAGANPMTSGR